jgi:hypothetical protein
MVDSLRRVQAARWVVVLGRVTTALLVVSAVSTVLVAFFTWSAGLLVLSVVYALVGGGWNALVDSFDRHGRLAWVVLLLWSATGAVGRLGSWLLGADIGLLQLAIGVLDAAMALLLVHPDTLEWVGGRWWWSGDAPRRGVAREAGMPDHHRRPHVQATEELR